MTKRTKWTEKDELVALWLYYTLKGSWDGRNPEVIKIAELLGRYPDGSYRHTPSSVAMKLSNYRACDPNRIGGLPNLSQDDIFYFQKYSQNIEVLFERVQKYLTDDEGNTPLEVYPEIPEFGTESFVHESADYSAPDIQSLRRVRTKQYLFRANLLQIYGHHCCLSGIGSAELLVASHIKPWAADIENRTNPRNGLLLNALLDRAFDQGLFTLDEHYEVKISSKIRDAKTKEYLSGYQGHAIILPDREKWRDCNPDPVMLEYHRDVIFEHHQNNEDWMTT